MSANWLGLTVVKVRPMQRIGFIAFPNFQVLSLCTVSVFECANILASEPLYELHMLSEAGGTIRTSSGLALETKKFDETEFDTLIVLGTLVDKPTFSPGLLSYVKNAPSRARRVASICTGALVLAEAGLLENRRVTTHWAYARYFRERFPNLNLEEDRIFIIDGSIWTSAGCTACIDLALAMVEKDAGKELARAVSRNLVMYNRRAGGQTQHSTLLELEPKSDRIQSALNYARCNLHTPLTVDQLAEAAHLSPRQFSRAFHHETGQSPAKAIENLRIEVARLMVEQGRHSIDVIAREAGFGSRDRMRRAFIRRFGQAPQEIRRDARSGGLRAALGGTDEIAGQSL
jgi:transcriptional regulator GlxA family with amidase domain